MNKRIAIPVIGVLAVGLIVTGVFYLQGTSKLGDAQDEIAGLQGDVSGLEGDLATTEADLAATEADLAATEAGQAATEVDLADSAARVSTLEGELDQAASAALTQQDINSTLSEELEKVKDPRHFETLAELQAWLAQDDTNTRVRWQSMPPNELVYVLQVRALRDGYILPAWFEDFDFDGVVDYVGNLAYIGEEIYYVWVDDDSTVAFAQMVPPIPPHPLPEE